MLRARREGLLLALLCLATTVLPLGARAQEPSEPPAAPAEEATAAPEEEAAPAEEQDFVTVVDGGCRDNLVALSQPDPADPAGVAAHRAHLRTTAGVTRLPSSPTAGRTFSRRSVEQGDQYPACAHLPSKMSGYTAAGSTR